MSSGGQGDQAWVQGEFDASAALAALDRDVPDADADADADADDGRSWDGHRRGGPGVDGSASAAESTLTAGDPSGVEDALDVAGAEASIVLRPVPAWVGPEDLDDYLGGARSVLGDERTIVLEHS